MRVGARSALAQDIFEAQPCIGKRICCLNIQPEEDDKASFLITGRSPDLYITLAQCYLQSRPRPDRSSKSDPPTPSFTLRYLSASNQ